MSHRVALIVAALLSLLPFHLQAATSTATDEHKRPVIALVLSGGGARGVAHIGVLKVLEEMHIPIDIIVGTSAGSAIGGLYAMGYSAKDIENLFLRTDFLEGFEDSTPREEQSFRRKEEDRSYLIRFDVGFNGGSFQLPRGLVQGQRLRLILNDMTKALPAMSFDRLPIRYRAVATDLTTGEQVALDHGHIAQAMHASMALPGVFEPVEMQGHLLVDGGIANNLPITVARNMGADVVIAVDISSPLRSDKQLRSVVDVVDQLTNFLTRRNVDAQIQMLRPQDVLITPNLSQFSNTDFDASPQMIDIGAQATRDAADKLYALELPEAGYQRYRAAKQPIMKAPGKIDSIVVKNHSHISDDFIRSRIQQEPGKPLDLEQVKKDVREIYGLGYFGQVGYYIDQTPLGDQLVVEAQEKSWGPNYLRFGLQIEEDFNGESNYNLATNYNLTALNRLGAEWSNNLQIGSEPLLSSEFYQPLSFESSYFVSLGAKYHRYTIKDYDNGQSISQLQVERYTGSFGFGKEFGNWGRAQMKIESGAGNNSVEIGPPLSQGDSFRVGEYQFDLAYDTLNSANFPTRGAYANFNYAMSRPALGADKIYDRMDSALAYTFSVRHYTLIGRATSSLLLKREGSVENAARLGGFLNLSGYNKNELSGEDTALVSLVAYRRFGKVFPYYLGGSFEMGNVWKKDQHFDDTSPIQAGSLFAGVDTFVGPVILAVGYSDPDHASLYFNIGKLF